MEHYYSWVSSTPRLCLLVIIFLAGTEMMHVESCPTLCTGDDCPPPPSCKFGSYPDNCGRTLCAKGPGEICGNEIRCGDGMYCQCGRCFGCSLLVNGNAEERCYDKPCM